MWRTGVVVDLGGECKFAFDFGTGFVDYGNAHSCSGGFILGDFDGSVV
jgi:hypothetical protein